jgi:nucleotide-binding universal stress UspA family protein
MDRIKKILAPTDLSDLSEVGVRYALELAQSQGAEVIVCHVVDSVRIPYPEKERATLYRGSLSNCSAFKDRIDKFLRKVFPDLIEKVKVRQEVEIGVAHERIVEKAADERVNMIVMSTHGRTGLLHMLMGSVSEQVVRRATCPVITVRTRKEAGLTEVRAA